MSRLTVSAHAPPMIATEIDTQCTSGQFPRGVRRWVTAARTCPPSSGQIGTRLMIDHQKLTWYKSKARRYKNSVSNRPFQNHQRAGRPTSSNIGSGPARCTTMFWDGVSPPGWVVTPPMPCKVMVDGRR